MPDLLPTQAVGYQRREVGRTDAQLQQEQFLEIMIAQLRAQDPTSPQDSNQFLGQLAQFGTVEGIGELNTNFELMSTALSANQALQAAELVDREVMVPGSRGYLGVEGALRGGAELSSDSQSVIVRIVNEAGEVVRRLDLKDQSAGLVEFEWDGLSETGERAPEGQYRVEVEALRNGEPVALPTLISARVQSVTFGTGAGVTLVELEGIGSHALNDVRQIRSAPPPAAPIPEPESTEDPDTSEGTPSNEETAFGFGPTKFFRLNTNSYQG